MQLMFRLWVIILPTLVADSIVFAIHVYIDSYHAFFSWYWTCANITDPVYFTSLPPKTHLSERDIFGPRTIDSVNLCCG